ncbi:hypothetical protein B5F76_12305 [Desulfovibrio sp. An276]|nr:hypothetical protein B5F76_12305 [Desulfovibrio sp. An276]
MQRAMRACFSASTLSTPKPAFFSGYAMSSDVLHLSPQQLVPLMPVLDALNDGMLIVDASGSVIAVNKAMRRLYHGGEVPYPGYPLSDFNAADWVEAKRVLTSGKPLLGQIMHLPAATVVASHLPIVHQGTVTGVVCAMQEIASLDDIVHKLQAYRELDAQLNGLLEALPQGVIVCDAKEHILRANTAGCRLCGREYGVVQGGSLEDLSADFKELAEGMRACLSSGLPSQSLVRHGEQSLFLWIVPILGESKSPDLVAATLVELDRFDALRVQLEAPERPAEEQVAGIDDGDMVQSVAAEVGMVVRSASIRRVVSRAIKVSQTDSSVLLQGESGTGKSMLASIIHKLSPRKNAPFVSINCGAIPEQLMESELFGYERGAFTGASPKGKTGLLEAAQGGTVFFDEIGELPLTMQVKLLEVLDRHAFLRIGGIKPVAVDVRIVAATNRNLEEEVEKGSFRRDLFYRLNVIPIHIPPLRERKEDIYALALSMLDRHNAQNHCHKRLSPEVIDLLLSHPFPGNARELSNIMEWMLVMSEGSLLRPEDLPLSMRTCQESAPAGEGEASAPLGVYQPGTPLKDILFSVEEACLREALASSSTMNEAAQSLGMHPTTLWRKLVQHNMGQEEKIQADCTEAKSCATGARTGANKTRKGREARGK